KAFHGSTEPSNSVAEGSLPRSGWLLVSEMLDANRETRFSAGQRALLQQSCTKGRAASVSLSGLRAEQTALESWVTARSLAIGGRGAVGREPKPCAVRVGCSYRG